MEFDDKIALIQLKPATKRIEKIVFVQNGLRFRCQRCAVFCCRLGSPKLLQKDVERLERAGHSRARDEFLDVKHDIIKNREDGSCIFLSATTKHGSFKCLIYPIRPTLCRLYPFSFETLNPDSYALKFIPCCNGVNSENGEIIDERFFDQYLKEILLDSIDSSTL